MHSAPQPYLAYKPSGIDWLGDIPAHWQVRRLKQVVSLNPSRTEARSMLNDNAPVVFLPMEKVGTDGCIDQSEIRPAHQVWNGFTYFKRGDVIVAKITPCFENGKAAYLDSLYTDIGFGSTEFHVLRANNSVNPEFVYRLITTDEFRKQGADAMTGAAGQQRVPASFVANYSIPLPPLAEQAAIARYLDRADDRIQRAISAKQRLTDLLTEQRQATIHHAVTRGLDENAPMKPSGIDWLGDVPAHWQVSRTKNEFISLNHQRIPLSSEHRGGMVVRQYDYYGASGVIDRVEDYIFDDELLLLAEDGANLVLRNLPLAIIARGKFWVNNHAHILKPKRGNLEFLAAIMESLDYSPWISGAAQPKLTLEHLMNIAIAVPSRAEQDQIIATVSAQTATLDQAIANAQRQIELLREYRTRLIADAVTGRVDARTAPTSAASPSL